MGITMYDSLMVTPSRGRLLGLECFDAGNLWTPPGNRGVFGGQVIAQALRAAIMTVQGMDLHSQHSYFLLPCDSRKPVTYAVERLRESKSYSTRLVHAIQNSETIFTLTASFSRPADPEGGRRFQRALPEGIKPFEEAWKRTFEDHVISRADFGTKVADTPENRRAFSEAERMVTAAQAFPQGGEYASRQALWLKPLLDERKMTPNEIRAMIGYMTDSAAIATAGRTVGLSAWSDPPLGMLATVDHTIHFYPMPDSYDGTQPVLHVMEAQVVDLAVGRGFVTGRLYTQDGVLIAATSQEGVVRQRKEGVRPRGEAARL